MQINCQPEFRERIGQRLVQRQMTRLQLADKCGINRTRLFDWLKGQHPLPEVQVNILCEFLDICE